MKKINFFNFKTNVIWVSQILSFLVNDFDASFSPARLRTQHFTSKFSVDCESWRRFARLKDVKSCHQFNCCQHYEFTDAVTLALIELPAI